MPDKALQKTLPNENLNSEFLTDPLVNGHRACRLCLAKTLLDLAFNPDMAKFERCICRLFDRRLN